MHREPQHQWRRDQRFDRQTERRDPVDDLPDLAQPRRAGLRLRAPISRRPTLREISSPSSVAQVMTPIPPTWTSARITTSPTTDQCVGVSTTIRPVTVTAETAVNTAGTNPVADPVCNATGSISPTVPTAEATANPASTAAAGRRARRASGTVLAGVGTPSQARTCPPGHD